MSIVHGGGLLFTMTGFAFAEQLPLWRVALAGNRCVWKPVAKANRDWGTNGVTATALTPVSPDARIRSNRA